MTLRKGQKYLKLTFHKSLCDYAVICNFHHAHQLNYNSNCKLFSKAVGGVDRKVYIFEFLNFGKFQVLKWASGVKRLFKVSLKD